MVFGLPGKLNFNNLIIKENEMLTSQFLNRRFLLSIIGIMLFFSASVIPANATSAELPAIGVNAGSLLGGPTGYVLVRRLNIRSGPGTDYPILGMARYQEVVGLTGRNYSMTWLRIRRANGQQGWALASFIAASAAHLAALPILDGVPPIPIPPTPSEATGYVTAHRLNVRAGPSLHHSLMGILMRGRWVSLIGRDTTSTWLQIRLPDNSQGWVSARYIWSGVPIYTLPVTGGPVPNPIPDTIGYVKVPKLNVRSGPGMHYGIMGWLYRYQRVRVLDRSYEGKWLEVEISPNYQGWVYARYIQSTVPDPLR
jgi:uncharacterized protein YraI